MKKSLLLPEKSLLLEKLTVELLSARFLPTRNGLQPFLPRGRFN